MAEPLPKVSFIMPTLNAAALLENCLTSIVTQTYPHHRYEIILADAMSKDATREIAAKYGAIVVDDRGRDMEQGKRLALQHATGEYIVFVDSDNEITHPDYIELAVCALAANPHALGVESYYLPSPRMSSFCAYITALLHISDPMSWMMSVKPRLIMRDGEVERWTVPGDSFAYPLGANGFVFRRADLEAARAKEQFQDTHIALHLMQSGLREWLRIRGRGVHHYYVQTWWGFVKKRRRATVHYFNVREETQVSWIKHKAAVPGWVAALYCATFVGPICHTMIGLLRDHDLRWLWHPLACFGSLLGTLWGWQTQRARGNERNIHDLQVDQSLKSPRTETSHKGRASVSPSLPLPPSRDI
jgi:glycosyltransferase involved in cell wall biosynthesis